MFKRMNIYSTAMVACAAATLSWASYTIGTFRGAWAGIAWVETQQYEYDTAMRKWFEVHNDCDLLDPYTDKLEKGFCIPKTGIEGFQRKKLYYGYDSPWGFVTISEYKNGESN